MSDAGAGRLSKKLKRILLLLPYAIRHPGVSVDELSRKFGVKKSDLLDDLDLVFMCGLPGYGPGDLIDVTVDDDKVYVRMADYFGAPLKLTPAEGLALFAGASAIAALPEMEGADALRRALDKLARAIGSVDADDGPLVEVALASGPSEHFASIRKALADATRVTLEYLSSSSGDMSSRSVDPWGLIVAFGRWYLVGFDHSVDEERMFRGDRIRSVSVTDEPAPVPEDFDPERYRSAFVDRADQPVMQMDISPATTRWFEEYYPLRSSTEADDDWRRVELAYGKERWAATLLLVLGEAARNVAPASLDDAARALAARFAARHEPQAV